MDIRIREISIDDSPVVEKLATTARSESIPSLKEVFNQEQRVQFYIDEIREKEGFVALDPTSKIIGFIIYVSREIDHLYIMKEFRGIGIGSILLENALGKMKSDNVFLYMFQENTRALDFYRKHGFEIASEGDGTNNEEGLPDYKLVKIVSNGTSKNQDLHPDFGYKSWKYLF